MRGYGVTALERLPRLATLHDNEEIEVCGVPGVTGDRFKLIGGVINVFGMTGWLLNGAISGDTSNGNEDFLLLFVLINKSFGMTMPYAGRSSWSIFKMLLSWDGKGHILCSVDCVTLNVGGVKRNVILKGNSSCGPFASRSCVLESQLGIIVEVLITVCWSLPSCGDGWQQSKD